LAAGTRVTIGVTAGLGPISRRKETFINIRKIINRRIRKQGQNVDLAGDVNAVISANVGERGSVTRTSSKQRVVQRSRAEASAGTESIEGGADESSG
jgi:hypothetical protein